MGRAGSEANVEGEHEKPLASVGSAAIGKYQVFASLGRGGMADVFLAVARGPMGFNKLAVIKRLRSNLADEPAFLNMFLDEARLAARLNHPNVVHTYEVGEHDGAYFIAMEFLEGQSLNKIIKTAAKGGLELDEPMSVRIVADVLAGLHHAHELRDYDGTPLKIIHRDISPHNVFVTYDGQIKLVDFGIAKAALSSTQTEVGVLKGKVAYMAPEQAMGSPIDRRADLFAMGIVMWEVIAKKRLFSSESAATTLHRLLNTPIPRLSSAVPNVDSELDEIVAKALEKDPDKRFQTAQEMRDALEGWLSQPGRSIRQDDIARRVTVAFQSVRDEVQRQVQSHMAAFASGAPEMAQLRLDGASPRSVPPFGPEAGSYSGTYGAAGSRASTSEVTVQHSQMQVTDTGAKKRRGLVLLLMLLPVVAVGMTLMIRQFGAIRSASVSQQVAANAAIESNDVPSAAAIRDRSPVTVPVVSAPIAHESPASPAPIGASGAGAAAGNPIASPPAPASAQNAVSPPSPIRGNGGRASNPTPRSHTGPSKPPVPAVSSTGADDEKGPGFLTLDTYPWTRVSEGGKTLGTTPLVRIVLPPGGHTLMLENSELGISQTYVVTIKSGEAISRRLGLK